MQCDAHFCFVRCWIRIQNHLQMNAEEREGGERKSVDSLFAYRSDRFVQFPCKYYYRMVASMMHLTPFTQPHIFTIYEQTKLHHVHYSLNVKFVSLLLLLLWWVVVVVKRVLRLHRKILLNKFISYLSVWMVCDSRCRRRDGSGDNNTV